MKKIKREAVEHTAWIMGPMSAAAQALKAAEAMEQPVFIQDGQTLLVIDGCAADAAHIRTEHLDGKGSAK